MFASAKIPDHITAAEFLAWDPQDGQAWQLVDGEPQAMSPAGVSHAGR